MNKLCTVFIIVAVSVALLAMPLPSTLQAQAPAGGVRVVWGPTPIMEGEAKGPGDLTIMNEYYAVAFALTTDPPWGIPRGHIVDLMPTGEGFADVLAQFSFPLNDWGNWAKIDLEKGFQVIDESPSRVIVVAVGTWKGLRVNYTYIFEAGKPYFKVVVNVTNLDTVAYVNHIMGPAITFETGWTFIPGFGTGRIVTSPRGQWGIIDDWVAGYHENFAVGLYAPNYTHISAHTMFVDPFYQVTLQPGESRVFEAWIMVYGTGDVCKIAEQVAQIRGQGIGYVEGSARTTKNTTVKSGVLVVEKLSKPYCWSIIKDGAFRAGLPAPDTYSVYAEARAHAPSSRVSVDLKPGDIAKLEFSDVKPPGYVNIYVMRSDTKKPTDAVVLISSPYTPVVRYIATTTAYTDPVNIGVLSLPLAPGNYTLQVGWAPGFLSEWVNITLSLSTDEVKNYTVEVPVLFKPWEYGWYMADLHHHSNYMDGRTPPEYVATAQSAFGLDFVVVSDHDFVGNCPAVKYYAELRNKTFICAVEISPEWAHFNAYPILYPEKLVLRGTMKQIIEGARAAGALVIRANHPYIGGLFQAQENNAIPGGYYEGWDVAEINGPWGSDDNATLTKLMLLWNMNIRKYLTAGSDVHDVWATPRSGFPRVVAYIPEGPTVGGLARAELTGRTFITYGPFVFTDPLPGTVVPVASLDSNVTVKLKLYAVANLSRVEVWSLGRAVRTISLSGREQELTVSLSVSEVVNASRGFGWIVFIVYDRAGMRAITNPIWIELNTIPAYTTVTETTTLRETVTITLTTQVLLLTTTTTTVTTATTAIATVTTTATQVSTYTYTSTHTVTERTVVTTTALLTTTTTREVEKPVTTTVTPVELVAAGSIVALIVGLAIGALVLKPKK